MITVGTTTANIQCDYDYIATLKKAYFCYGEGEIEDNFSSAEMHVVQNTLYVELIGLKANTTYRYYYEFHNGFNSMRTALKSFKTEVSPTSVTLPTVVTASVTEITANSAKGGGEVTNDGGAEVTERGICWSTNENPTLSDNHVAAGEGTGAFTAMMNGLEDNTTYHIRAYATNEVGTAYGLDGEFVTISGGGGVSGAPEGAIDGLFSVSPTQKVYFSQGNLQYQASTNTWRFAENQWDYVGDYLTGNVFENGEKCNNYLASDSYSGWIDEYGWGTSGYDHGAICYYPWSNSNSYTDYFAYGSESYNLFDQTGVADWGYNAICNGGNETDRWRTLTSDEWDYVVHNRNTMHGQRYAKATIDGIQGLVLFPDNWNDTYPSLNSCNMENANFSCNSFSTSFWENELQSNGAVFLPATEIYVQDTCGCYWLSTYINIAMATSCSFACDYITNGNGGSTRCVRLTVRLVQDANPQNKAK